MALLLPLKLPSLPLALSVIIVCTFSETVAFQFNFLPFFAGEQNRSCRQCISVGQLPSHLRIRVTLDDNEKEQLIEQENPQADFDQTSLSGVRYGSVFGSLGILYPPTDLEKRNAVSRSDGYWPFINSGKEPPKQFTYGEFDLYFFAQLLDQALVYYNEYQEKDDRVDTWNGKVFTDIGSGTGRLVFAAAALHPGWKLCRGLEVLEGIHKVAVETLETCRREIDVGERTSSPREDDTQERPCEESKVDRESNDRSTAWKAFASPFSVVQQQDDDWLNILKLDYNDVEDDAARLDTNANCEEATTNIISGDKNDNKDGFIHGEAEIGSDSFDMYILQVPSNPDFDDDEMLCLAPIEFACGSFEDPYEYIGDSDLIFVFSSCMSDDMMLSLSKAIGRQCKPGTIVITTDYSLPLSGYIEPLEDDETMPSGSYKLDLLESIDGWCWLTGGRSTAHIHRVVSSLWEEGVGRRQKPELSLEEQAWRVVQAYEAGELTDPDKFLRDVRNNMIFVGLPDSWLPDIDDNRGDGAG